MVVVVVLLPPAALPEVHTSVLFMAVSASVRLVNVPPPTTMVVQMDPLENAGLQPLFLGRKGVSRTLASSRH